MGEVPYLGSIDSIDYRYYRYFQGYPGYRKSLTHLAGPLMHAELSWRGFTLGGFCLFGSSEAF